MATLFQPRWRLAAGVLGLLGIGLALAVGLLAPEPAPEPTPPEAGAAAPGPFQADRAEPILPLAAAVTDAGKVALGRKLFHEAALSGDGTMSCATCHDLGRGGADARPRPIGSGGVEGVVNVPSILNAALGFRQFWDGRAATLEDQIDEPLHARHEMNSSWPQAGAALGRDPAYRAAFAKLYPEGGITADHVKDALAEFQRSLLAPAPFDRFLAGDGSAISGDAKAGYRLFKSLGCVACHQGTGVGGNMYQRMGLLADYFADRGGVAAVDFGRYNVTGREEDRFVFKVPSLRNVALTAPYFHDGSAATLEVAVRTMARYQLGREVTAGETKAIVAFLESLTAAPLPTAGPGS